MWPDLFALTLRFGPSVMLATTALMLALRTRRTSQRTGRTAYGFGRTGRQRAARVLFGGSIAVGAIATLAHALDLHWGPFGHDPALRIRLRGLGLVVAATGSSIVLLACHAMGLSWRVGIPKEAPEELVTTGLFRYSRNPVFLGMTTLAIGLAMALPSLTMVIAVAAFILACEIQIRDEETLLEATFGDDYWAYRQRVRRWI